MSSFSQPIALVEARAAAAEAIQPAHFFIGPDLALEWEHLGEEEISWEIFQGRLLDAAQTRQRRAFEAWNVFWCGAEGRSAEPLLALKLDAPAGCFYVLRSIYSYAQEGYHAGDNIYLSREVHKWLRELVATIPLPSDRTVLEAALATSLFQAVVGLSRLPLHSVEAPLPAFSLGQLAYFSQPTSTANGPMGSYRSLIDRALTANQAARQQAKLLEFSIRATPSEHLADACRLFAAKWREVGGGSLPALFRSLFEEVSLSPYTDFVAKTLTFLRLLEEQGHWSTAEHIDFLSSLLRQLGRHLAAYDLVVFHHRGANYPDALLLNAALDAFLELVKSHPALFAGSVSDDEPAAKAKRLRRRALRQAVMLRCQYEGHEVPDVPTSPGENLRILPEPNHRVPEEQIIEPGKRQRRLFADDPLFQRLSPVAASLLQESIEDLEEPAELRELGMALFLDRPLGIFKRPTELDETLLLSYEAFSPSVAERRLQFLAEKRSFHPDPARLAVLRDRLRQGDMARGIPLEPRAGPVRPGVVSLSDALKAAPDFVLLQSTRRAIREFRAQYDLESVADRLDLDFLVAGRRALVVGGAAIAGNRPGTLLIYDEDFCLRLEMEIEPTASLRVLRSWTATGHERDWRGEEIWLPIRPAP